LTQDKIQRLIQAFDVFDKTYKRAELEEAIDLREEITPHLISILEKVADDPEGYIADESFGNIYASALLSHFREPRAHHSLIRAFSLNRTQINAIWGDISTETFPAMLLNTCGGSMADIQELVRNRDADEYVRASAMTAITFAVASGVISRRDALAFFATLFDRSLAEEDSYFWQGLIYAIEAIEGIELSKEVRALAADELVSYGEVAPWLLEGEQLDLFVSESEKELKNLKRELALRVPKDIHGYCSWFGCFQEELPYREFDDNNYFAPELKERNTDRKKKDKSRKKRKQAKQSKRKNRK